MKKLPEWMINTPMLLRGVRLTIHLMTDTYIFIKYPSEDYHCAIEGFTDRELFFFAHLMGKPVTGAIPFLEIRTAIENAF